MRNYRSGLVIAALATIVASLVTAAPERAAGGMGIVPTPPMGVAPYGYNSLANYDDTSACHWDQQPPDFDLWACQLPANTDTMWAQAQALVRPVTPDGRSLADLGYTLIQLDAEWQGPRNGTVDALTGQPTMTPNPLRFGTVEDFTSLIAQIKSTCGPATGRCLEVGIYSDIHFGMNCGLPQEWAYWDTNNGLYNNEVTDARTFASWGITAIKIDHTCDDPPNGVEAELAIIRDAFDQHAPNIWTNYWFSPSYTDVWREGDLCGCFDDPGNQWGQASVLEFVDAAVASNHADIVGPGKWYDMEPLLLSGNHGWGGPGGGVPGLFLSPEEQQAQFAIEVLFVSPLLAGTDLRKVVGVPGDPSFPGDQHALNILTNEDLIQINQDPRGDMARLVADGPGYMVVSKVLSSSGQRAVGLINRTETDMDITFQMNTLRRDDGSLGAGLHDVSEVTDVQAHVDALSNCNPARTECTFSIPAHGVGLLRIAGTTD